MCDEVEICNRERGRADAACMTWACFIEFCLKMG